MLYCWIAKRCCKIISSGEGDERPRKVEQVLTPASCSEATATTAWWTALCLDAAWGSWMFQKSDVKTPEMLDAELSRKYWSDRSSRDGAW